MPTITYQFAPLPADKSSTFTIVTGSLALSYLGFNAKDTPLFCTVNPSVHLRKIGRIASKYRVKLYLASRLFNWDYLEFIMNSKRLLTETEASRVVGLAVSTLRNDRSLGRTKITYVKLGRLIRYRLSDIENYLDSLPQILA